MKRSEINRAMHDMLALLAEQRFALPPFAQVEPATWAQRGDAFSEIRDAGLGWDVTDFGSNDFQRTGLTLFTLRNGRPGVGNGKTYCEKIMMVRARQVTPMHFHWQKTEDIINRGGGELVCRLLQADDAEEPTDRCVAVSLDGELRSVPAGGEIVLRPGESITLVPFVYHTFWGAPGGGPVLVGEVSTVNDDTADNRFLDPLPRHPGIEEDEAPYRLLCNEYPRS